MNEEIGSKFNKVEDIKGSLNKKKNTLNKEEEELINLKIKIEPASSSSDYEMNIA